MNAFADTLLSLMFGWLRSLVEGIWSSASSGSLKSFFVWLGDHWYWLVLALCIICMVLDYLIWLIRWQPYIIWRNKLRRLLGHKERREAMAFEEGYDTGVDMDISDIPQEAVPDYSAWQPEIWVQPSLPAEPPVISQPEPVYEAPSPAVLAEEMPFVPETPTVRHRRSERHEKKKFNLPGFFGNDESGDDELLDGLPPAVRKEDAFHAPVYPEYMNKDERHV